MAQSCSSVRRCYSLACEPCAWRYSLNISRRILAHDHRRLFAMSIQPNVAEIGEFSGWRTAVRNTIDYRRGECRWWRDLGVWGWLGADGSVRGIVSLGSVTEGEFCGVFGRRWPISVRPITPTNLRHVIYWEAMRPSVIVEAGPQQGRYQHIKITIEPQRTRGPTHGLPMPTWPCGMNANDPLLVVL
jgi:hypothetical protein